MAIFQKSVINKHLSLLDQKQVDKAYENFIDNYDSAKIAKIKTLKEEEYQDGFLRDIFVNVLGYTLKPDEGHNLEREFKNQTDSKKADGAIIKDEEAIVVIELKSTKTRDLKNVTQQAFNYKNNQPECKYVITSNFQKLRFYIDHANEFEEFDLFHLSREDFELFYLILNKDNIFADVPLALKTETKFHDQEISGKLYKDYSSFKRKLFENLVKNNADADKLTLFIKSQKLLDRFLFILFAEDSGLLPPNSISRIVEHFHKLEELDAYKPSYEILKQYFGYMNIGRKGKNSPVDDIPAYNGGLFYADDLLDNLKIDDDILIDDLLSLSEYDFNTDIDVNILGHIFEHSLSEIEEITAEIEGTAPDKSKSKRKKDGVFYTPKYITAYIVENTIGALCNEKRKELGIGEIEFDETYRTKADKLTVKGKKLYQQFMDYKDWLIGLKIVDPACGSGAFLNQALNYLIQEHKDIDDFIAELTNTLLPIFDIDKTILENNLYGVDINEESIEIAKLSLWLRTAQKGRKLSNLNGNIKCGNSLISDKEVAGDKVFDWNIEFKDIMDNGGFDVVIGNPPYIKEYTNKQAFNGLHKHYCYQGKMDLWYFFGSLALEVVKKEIGLISYIAPNNWITNSGASKFRNIVINNGKLVEFIDFGDFKVFDTAGIQTMIYIMKCTNDNQKYSFDYSRVIDKRIKHESAQLFLEKLKDSRFDYFITEIDKKKNLDKTINFINAELSVIINKIKHKQNFIFDKKEVAQGIVSPQDFLNKKNQEILGEDFKSGEGIFNLSQKEYKDLNLSLKEKGLVKPFYTTAELERYYGSSQNKLWVIYTNSSFKKKETIASFPNLKAHLDRFQDVITSSNKPYGLHRAREEKFFQGEKIISLRKCVRPTFTFTDFDCYVSQTYFSIKTEQMNMKYLTGLLNSNLIAFWLKYKGKMQGDLYQVDKEPLLNLPIIRPSQEAQAVIADLVSGIITNKQKEVDYQQLLDKAKIENNFDREIQLQNQLDRGVLEIKNSENEIDQIVYKLYELTDEEIAIVENSIN